MKIREVISNRKKLVGRLSEVWEKSVRATHLFLSEENRNEIACVLPAALCSISHLVIAVNDKDDPIAFMGIEGNRLEMLFLSPEERGKGLGRQLLELGIQSYSVKELTVNEQNPQARAFYEHMGFQVYKRSDIDEQGNPFPILFMRITEPAEV